jgi:hypothetical protein
MTEAAGNEVKSIISKGEPVIFKIGITADPERRFFNLGYGYSSEYARMEIVAVTTPAWAVALERWLISEYKGASGCRNEADGGESAPRAGPVFVYLVWITSEEFTARRLKRKRAYS